MSTRSTIAITKTALKLSRMFGKGGGTALPGLIAERLQPDLPGRLAAQLPNGVILVTGTNGKTTTTKLLLEMLEANGELVLSNRAGSNLRRGIISTLINASDSGGHINATVGLFEVDEATLPLVAEELKPKVILVLNLFRDQLDRFGELDTLAGVIGRGIAKTKAELYLNADDPLVASLAKYAQIPGNVTFFGIEGLPASGTNALQTASDSDRCPVCGTKLKFERIFYGHIGHYECPKGDFKRPQPEVTITSGESASLTRQTFTMAIKSKRCHSELALPGTYNLYNALAATSVASGQHIPIESILTVLKTTKAAFGRVEQVKLGSKTLYLLLIKNPAGFTQVIETFLRGQEDKPVLFAINDNPADGRDISWLWDVPLEALQGTKLSAITTGSRGTDMALRLKYAGLDYSVIESVDDAINSLIRSTPENGTAYILPTYTAMLHIRNQLSKMTKMDEVWK